MLALALQETLFVVAWGALGGALFLPLTSIWFFAVPPAMLTAIYFLVLMELSGDANPLISLEIRQHSLKNGRKISRWAVYFRIFFTVIFFPAALLGYIPLLFGKKSLPELLSGSRLFSIDRRLDPRPESAIEWINKRSKIRVRTLTFVPMAAAASVFILLYSAPDVVSVQLPEEQYGLPPYEQELLTNYLELISLHPDELEYHVRLASLYYRNDMQQDLAAELAIIRQIDPGHAILILADTTSFTFSMLEPLQPDSAAWTEPSTEAVASLLSADSSGIAVSDSLAVPQDSIIPTVAPEITDAMEETALEPEWNISPSEEEEYSTEELQPPGSGIPDEGEEETVAQDTLVQP